MACVLCTKYSVKRNNFERVFVDKSFITFEQWQIMGHKIDESLFMAPFVSPFLTRIALFLRNSGHARGLNTCGRLKIRPLINI